MSDLKKYIAKRKRSDKEFAEGFVEGYEQLKIGVVTRKVRESARSPREDKTLRPKKRNRKVLRIGIMSTSDYKKRSQAIARGEYRPQPDEPKVWFESVRSMAQVLSNENQVLLKTILERKPESLKELEAATGRSSGSLSRTLKTMARYGIVRMEKVHRNIRPVVEATDFTVQFGLYASSRPERAAGDARI